MRSIADPRIHCRSRRDVRTARRGRATEWSPMALVAAHPENLSFSTVASLSTTFQEPDHSTRSPEWGEAPTSPEPPGPETAVRTISSVMRVSNDPPRRGQPGDQEDQAFGDLRRRGGRHRWSPRHASDHGAVQRGWPYLTAPPRRRAEHSDSLAGTGRRFRRDADPPDGRANRRCGPLSRWAFGRICH